MSPDPDVSTSFGWAPELELGDVARRLLSVYSYLSRLADYLSKTAPSAQMAARLETNHKALEKALLEVIDRVQRQDSLDIGDPDINEEIVGTLRQVLVNLIPLSEAKTLRAIILELEEAAEAISDLAEHITSY